jgi:ribose transport system substrate-binding protein
MLKALAGTAVGLPLISGCMAPAGAPAATQGQGGGKKRKIIFVTHDLNAFFVPAIVGLKDFGALAGWDTEFVGPASNDAQKCVEMQHNAIAAKPDAVGFTAIDSDAFIAPIKSALDKGIFVVLYNTRAPGVKEKTGAAYVGQEFLTAGHVAGEQLCNYIVKHTGRKDGKIVFPIIAPGHFALETRNKGGMEAVQAYNKAKGTAFVSEAMAVSLNESEAVAKFEAKYNAEKSQIVGWLSSDLTHGYIGTWAKKAGLVGKFAVGGYDLLDQTLENIKNGSVDFTIGQNPYAQGFLTASLIYQGLERGYPASDIDTGAELVDASNVAKVIAREALWKDKGKALGVIK